VLWEWWIDLNACTVTNACSTIGGSRFRGSTTGPGDESSGWYLSYVYDPVREGSDLVILDASDFGGAPVATISLPQRVPFGFHGNWIGA